MTDIAETALRPAQLLVLDPRQAGWPAALAAAGSDTAVLLLDAERDGLQQVAEVAAEYAPLKAIHLPEHGVPGQVVLGRTVLSAAHLTASAATLAKLADTLAPEGVLRLGGEPGRGVLGRRLADLLSEVVGRAVLPARHSPVLALTAGAAGTAPWPVWSQPGTAILPAVAGA
ncbi:DUF4347 domain-containing protein [Roseomonas sp. E05]|uniref:DUF4347 domain-containing protein n=1 Tax=Roseomonas sp. E05 TaxID=3046310 RepID=UPI0024B8D887|nr:DUF4347 domain-containing protein [Roseomonas sp. E05]MDJ0388271.1 DUF4347 domain-containing protein [Roseomonas sp. E05]